MSQNDRLCKVCGYPKRKFSNGCSNPLCNFNEPEIINDLDQITVMNTVKLNQSKYLDDLFLNTKNTSTLEEFSELISKIDILVNSPLVDSETISYAKKQAKPIGLILLEFICKDAQKLINSLGSLSIKENRIVIEISKELSNDIEKLRIQCDLAIDQLNISVRKLEEVLPSSKKSFYSSFTPEIKERIDIFKDLSNQIRLISIKSDFSIIEVGIKTYSIEEKGSKPEIITETFKISEELNSKVKYFKNNEGDDILFARQEGTDTFSIEFYIVNHMKKKTTLNWRLKNYLKDQKSFQKIGFSFNDGKVYLHHLVNSSEYKYAVEVKNLVF